MDRKSTHTPEHDALVAMLKDARAKAGISQERLATLVGRDQSIVSRWETGELRLDLVQLRDFCLAVGISLTEFVAAFEEKVKKTSSRRTGRGAKKS